MKYRVPYWIEQGHFIIVEADSPEAAEEMVEEALNNDTLDELGESKQVHGDSGVLHPEEYVNGEWKTA